MLWVNTWQTFLLEVIKKNFASFCKGNIGSRKKSLNGHQQCVSLGLIFDLSSEGFLPKNVLNQHIIAVNTLLLRVILYTRNSTECSTK